jgi:hypothetical protein
MTALGRLRAADPALIPRRQGRRGGRRGDETSQDVDRRPLGAWPGSQVEQLLGGMQLDVSAHGILAVEKGVQDLAQTDGVSGEYPSAEVVPGQELLDVRVSGTVRE